MARVILGTRALHDPDGCAALCRRFPGRVALGIDARNGRVSTEGWLRDSDTLAEDLARRAAGWGVAAIVYTDIQRDGMLGGANVEATAELARAVPGVPVIASGGVAGLDDIARLARAGASRQAVEVAPVGQLVDNTTRSAPSSVRQRADSGKLPS